MNQAIIALLSMLDTLDGWIDDILPLQSPQRFGNQAFRTWGDRLTEARLIDVENVDPSSCHRDLINFCANCWAKTCARSFPI